jgi:polyhydroxyalkanoate synthesis repressor PhaR
MDRAPRPEAPVRVKKYSNRRFYDNTNGRHVSLSDLHDLIVAGHDIQVVDSKSDADITHVVLTQIILDRHAPKLAIFPAPILHQIIRTQQPYLGEVVEQFVRQSLATSQQVQAQWSRVWQGVLGVPPTASRGPADWTRVWLGALGAAPPTDAPAEVRTSSGPDPSTPAGGGERRGAGSAAEARDELDALRRQIEALTRRLEALDPPPRRRRRRTR